MQAVSLLRELGYTNVAHYPGGLTEWFGGDGRPEQRALSSQPVHRADPVAPRAMAWSSRLVLALADRSVRDLFYLWVAIVVVWGMVYWLMAWLPSGALVWSGATLAPDAAGWLSAVYFSAVTATSVGYGDIVPIGLARVLAIAEGIAGLILFGCVVSKFVSRRQEEVIG